MSTRFVPIACLCFLLATPLRAQDDATAPDAGWKIRSVASLNLTQSSFNSAWAGDAVGTVSWALTSTSEAEKQLTPWANWLSTLQLQFGQTHQQDQNRRRWLSPVKSADKIAYRGIVRFNNGNLVDPFLAFDVDSQFFQEDTLAQTTRMFTPTTFSESVGIAHAIYDNKQKRLITRFGVTAKHRVDRLFIDTIVKDVRTRSTTETGVEWLTQSRFAAVKDRTVYVSELRLFKALTTSEETATRQHWPAIDVDWQNTLSNKLTKWFSFDLYWQLLYDKQIDVRGQFKQTLGFGLTWQFI